MWISVCSLPEWRRQITFFFFFFFYGNVLIFSIKRQIYSNHLLYCSWWISRFLWYTSPPGAICESDAAGSIQIKTALFFPTGKFILSLSQLLTVHTHTHTHTHGEYSAAPPIHPVLTCPRWTWTHRCLAPLIDGGWTESWENVWVSLSRSFQPSVCVLNLAV